MRRCMRYAADYQSPAYPTLYGLVIRSMCVRLNSTNWRTCRLSCATQLANISPALMDLRLLTYFMFQSTFFKLCSQVSDCLRSLKNFLCMTLKFCSLYFRDLTQANGEMGCHSSC